MFTSTTIEGLVRFWSHIFAIPSLASFDYEDNTEDVFKGCHKIVSGELPFVSVLQEEFVFEWLLRGPSVTTASDELTAQYDLDQAMIPYPGDVPCPL